MERVLVHICCAPDAVYFLKRLRQDYPDSELIGFFYDPNIHPYEEYKLRLKETQRVCKKLRIELIEGEYDLESWLDSVKGLENEPERGERCSVCFDFRLERSAQLAKELGCDSFTTTLLMSPKKRFDQLKESGERVARRYNIGFLAVDYRKGGGVQEMFKLTKENEIYKQDYCGCVYALFQQKGEASLYDLLSFKGRRPGSKEERLFIKEIRMIAEHKGLEVEEIEFPFMNWIPLRGGIWINGKAIPSIVKPFSQSIRGKVRADVERVAGNTLYLSKQFVRIELAKSLKDEPLDSPTYLTYPTFIVPEAYRDILLSARIDAELQTDRFTSTSSLLIVGTPEAQEVVSIPADTLQDGRGIDTDTVTGFLTANEGKIKGGGLCLVVAGAYSLGKLGARVFEELTGSRIGTHIGYDYWAKGLTDNRNAQGVFL